MLPAREPLTLARVQTAMTAAIDAPNRGTPTSANGEVDLARAEAGNTPMITPQAAR